jgi:MoaA/NifB/PqqE/SkfB family radical SAM enzyme
MPVVVSATLTKEVIEDMQYLAELAMEKKFRVQYSILYNHGDADQKSNAMKTEEVKAITIKILSLKKMGYPIYYHENVLKATIDWPLDFSRRFLLDTDPDFEEVKKKADLIPCFHGSLKYQIDADGRVVVCWAQNNPNAPNIKTLGIKEAFKQVYENNHCRHCAYLANNEQNGVMQLSPTNIWGSICIQFADALKLRKNVAKNQEVQIKKPGYAGSSCAKKAPPVDEVETSVK